MGLERREGDFPLSSIIQGGFFDWSALKMTKYEEKIKYLNWSANWHLFIFRADQ